MATERPNLRNPRLKQTLYGFQIYFIVLSAVIGGGVFNNNGEALELSGPAGLLLSVVAIGVVAMCVSECVAELTQQFPVYNAIVEFVRVFVDEELGWVIGIAYWYTFSSVFALQNLAAANLSQYWGLSQTWQTWGFYVFAPLVILILNLLGVFYYGIVETIGGFLKVCLVLGVSIFLYFTAAKNHLGGASGPINEGFDDNTDLVNNNSKAVCYAIPLVAFSYTGVEIIAMTAFEARDAAALRRPSRWIGSTVFLLYFLCTVGEVLNVKWNNPHLPYIYGGAGNGTTATPNNPRSTSLLINAAWGAGYPTMASILNGCLIFSVLSASNTSLYVSSRTLYGLTREIPDTNWFNRQIRWLSLVAKGTGVPAASLLFSAVSFFWLPFLQLRQGYALEDLIEIMSVSASVACLIVWAALCLAFIRYYWWLKICDSELQRLYPEFRRDSEEYRATTLFDWLQPGVAIVGLIGCLLVFGFCSATWWDTPATFTKVAIAYAAHIVLFALLIILKGFNNSLLTWGTKLEPDVQELFKQLDRLNFKKLRTPESAKHRLKRLMHFRKRKEVTSHAESRANGMPVASQNEHSMMAGGSQENHPEERSTEE